AIASMCGVLVTIEPYWLIAWQAWSSDRISRMLGRRVVMLLLEAGRIGGLSAGGAGGQARQLVLGEIEQPGDRGGEVPAGRRWVRGGRAARARRDAAARGAQRLGVGLRPGRSGRSEPVRPDPPPGEVQVGERSGPVPGRVVVQSAVLLSPDADQRA